MCGRYYIDDDTAKEIQKLIRDVEERQKIAVKDIRPTEQAPILYAEKSAIRCCFQQWGFPGVADNKLIINARSESAMEKRMFRDGVERRRIVIPAAGFYEWNVRKEKNTFTRRGHDMMYMAGIYSRFENEDRFVILTTSANESMAPVHDRMPLILEKEEVMPWLMEGNRASEFLHKVPCLLERSTEYEQMSLF